MPNPNLPIGGQYNVYHGARYVPLITGPWSSTTAYEPLSIVTYEGNSYTSRTFVPAGTAPTNETYWVATGNYNAQVEQYRKEVADLTSTVNDQQTEITSLQNQVTTIMSHKIVFCGDSYGDTGDNNNWVDFTASMCNITEFVNACVSGASFAGAIPYSDQLNNSGINFTPTEVILCGGINDQLNDQNAVLANINNFINLCHTKWPKCKVSIGYISIGSVALTSYTKCSIYGAFAIPFAWKAMKNIALVKPDGVHPTVEGQRAIAEEISNYILGGTALTNIGYLSTSLYDIPSNITVPAPQILWFHGTECYMLSANISINSENLAAGPQTITIGKMDLNRMIKAGNWTGYGNFLNPNTNNYVAGQFNFTLNADGTLSLYTVVPTDMTGKININTFARTFFSYTY